MCGRGVRGPTGHTWEVSYLYKKLFSFLLCLLLLFTLSCPRTFAIGVGGFVATDQTLGFIGSLLGSLGIVFDDANQMHKGVGAYVDHVVDSPLADAWQSWQEQTYIDAANKLVIPAATFQSLFPDIFRSVLEYFAPGSSVEAPPSAGSIVNLGEIYIGSLATNWHSSGLRSGVSYFSSVSTSFNTSSSTYLFKGSANNGAWPEHPNITMGFVNCSLTVDGSLLRSVSDSGDTGISGFPKLFFYAPTASSPISLAVIYGRSYNHQYLEKNLGLAGPLFNSVVSVSGAEGDVIPVFQQPGALNNDLVGGIWDQLGQDAVEGNGAVVVDTNLPAYQGAATGMIGGDPDTNIAAPQDSTLQGIGATHTETDAETGTQTSTQVQTGTGALSQTGAMSMTDTQAQTSLNGLTLTLADVFPFCIPFDVLAMFRGLAAARETPHFDVRLYYPGWLDYTYTFDFSDWEPVAQVLRTCELAAFAIGLAAVTRRFIKW